MTLRSFLCTITAGVMSLSAADTVATNTPTKPMSMSPSKTEFAVLGGGCFWCVEAVYERIAGVKAAVSGYAGGKTEKPTYREVCDGETGHAEVVQIEFDPAVISFSKILDIFWEAHDPTTLNSQGPDHGTQYRSVIFYTSPEQKAVAERSKGFADASGKFSSPIVTEISPLTKFWTAEDYHQDYFRNNPRAGYCRAVISPKLQKLEYKKVIPEQGK
jgi:peptide-methionine (S)-S-oxide reductase